MGLQLGILGSVNEKLILRMFLGSTSILRPVSSRSLIEVVISLKNKPTNLHI